MGLFNYLFRDGIKCYRCGERDTEYLSGHGDLSIFNESMQEWIIDNCFDIWYPEGPNIYYCHHCKRFIVDYPSTSSFRGHQVYFTYDGPVYKK